MDDLQRTAGRGDEIDDMAEAALVLEGEIRRVVEVDMRLRGTVDEQRPGVRALTVGYQLGQPAVDLRDDGLGAAPGPAPAPLALRHPSIIRAGGRPPPPVATGSCPPPR